MFTFFFVAILFSATIVGSTRTVFIEIRVRSALEAVLLNDLLMKRTSDVVHDTQSAHHLWSPMKHWNLNRIALMSARGFGRKR